jgi:hypothetical protein
VIGGVVVVAMLAVVGLWQVFASSPAEVAPSSVAPVSVALPPPSTVSVPPSTGSPTDPTVSPTTTPPSEVPLGVEPPAMSQRTITSDPVADVYLDGVLVGHTPHVLSVPPDGAVSVQLRARGYRNAERTIRASDPEPVSVTLERAARATHSDLPTLAPH